MNQKDRDRLKEREFLSLIKNASRNRLIITSVVLITFLLIMGGIGLALLGDTNPIDQEWKEILLLVLGAFIASYGKIIDFWFQKDNQVERELIDAAEGDEECKDCDKKDC